MKVFSLLMMFVGNRIATNDKHIPICENPAGCFGPCNPPSCHLVPRRYVVHDLSTDWRFEKVSDERVSRYFMRFTKDDYDCEDPDFLCMLVPCEHVQGLLAEARPPPCPQHVCEQKARVLEQLSSHPTCEQVFSQMRSRRDEL
ncbi:hypothetical protein SVAN01_10261 [Stagonosporopsis vannaccii]|nr:hypothetical protein SVAN01_10261 [Stagonosporopsis vannaccii]